VTEPIHDADALLRRIPDRPAQWTKRSDGTARPSSASMKPSSEDGGLSVDVRRLLDDPTDPTSVLNGLSGFGLVEFEAAVPRTNGLEVEHTPLSENHAHADIRGLKRCPRRMRSERRKHWRKRRPGSRCPQALSRPVAEPGHSKPANISANIWLANRVSAGPTQSR